MPEETEPATSASDTSPDPILFRAGFVAIVGLPNVGKSTLLNGLVGVRLAAVTAKAQTTRRRLLGIYSDQEHQAVFIDTPGLLEPRYMLQAAMAEEAGSAQSDADLVVYVVDSGYPRSVQHAREFTLPVGSPGILCLNKADRGSPDAAQELRDGFADGPWDAVTSTVATEGSGIADLLAAILERLPESPALYPTDELSTAPLRYFAAEFVRESAFEMLEQEVPYSLEVAVEEFKEREGGRPTYIQATVYVERKSQKGIVIGQGGTMIRAIGADARRKIEAFLDHKVYLELRVKVLPNWRKKREHLKMLGYRYLPRER